MVGPNLDTEKSSNSKAIPSTTVTIQATDRAVDLAKSLFIPEALEPE
jgi:hypothetical protein